MPRPTDPRDMTIAALAAALENVLDPSPALAEQFPGVIKEMDRKLLNGHLPHDGMRKVWSSPSDGETCDACDATLSKDQWLMEGITLDLGRRPLQLHVRCFQVWDHERHVT